MKRVHTTLSVLGAALGLAGLIAAATPAAAADDGQFIPGLPYRTGPYAPTGIPFADGVADYYKLINERDGGINGVKILFEECDTAYNTDRAVECYERLKGKGPTGASSFIPLSTGATYALIERTVVDKIPLFTSGYGRTDAGDGRVFPYVFTLPASYWTGADAIISYIAQQEGGFAKLKGKKIAFVHHDSPFGKEPLPVLTALAEKHGFQMDVFPVAAPGLEQKAVWLRIGRQLRPDWTVMWGWGVMNATALKEAAAVGYKMDRFIGIWWSGSEQDVTAAGPVAKGYKSIAYHAPGAGFRVHQEIKKMLYDAGKGTGDVNEVGTVLYNRGVYNAAVTVEAIRTAQGQYGKKPLTGEQVRWGFENLNLSAEAWSKLGLDGFAQPIKVSCADHEASTALRVQQWDGDKWVFVSDWIQPHLDLIRPMIEASAGKFAAEKGITLRTCN